MKDKIINIIEEVSGYENLRENLDVDFLRNEILDSLAFIELISTLNDEFNIEIQPTQVKPETWRNVDKIVELVESLQQ